MNEFSQRIVQDLREFSADLLEVGLSSRVTSRTAEAGSVTSLLGAISSLTALVPRLLVELRTSEAPTRFVENVTYVPTGATLSRRPADYRLSGDTLLPLRWVRMVPLEAQNPRALRWLLHLIDCQRNLLREHMERMEDHVAEALAARRGRSLWAQADENALRGIMERLQGARSSLERARQSVSRAVGERPFPSATPPAPFPATQAWVSLRRLARRLTEPESLLPEHLGHLLGGTAVTADLPYLYQRWCGVKMVEVLRSLGWEPRTDPVGALFLGGQISFRHQGHSIDLWVEPRLSRDRDHPSGFRCSRGEDVTPDYLFVSPGPGGLDAFVLDATLVTRDEDLVSKGRYLDLVELAIFATIAGCPVKRRPRLAWAAAPVAASHGKIHRPDGRTGTVPMNPIDWSERPIKAWLKDITRHALAWSLVETVS